MDAGLEKKRRGKKIGGRGRSFGFSGDDEATGRGEMGGGGGREGREGDRYRDARARGREDDWDGVGEDSGMGNCSLLGDDDQVGRKKNRRSI